MTTLSGSPKTALVLVVFVGIDVVIVLAYGRVVVRKPTHNPSYAVLYLNGIENLIIG